MYPWFRAVIELLRHRNAPPLGPFDTQITHLRCWPGDIDPWLELNNGRTLTLFDLGRIALASRTGMSRIARQNGWGMAIAGASVRYRKRVRLFDRIEMRSRMLGWDQRFVYIEQSMWVRGDCTSQVLLRSAITSGARGIVPPAELARAFDLPEESPPLPDWVMAWIQAEGERPWPPAA